MIYFDQDGENLEKSINSLVILILTQTMIFLGEIPNPLTGRKEADLDSALRYIQMLTVLHDKTRGNLDEVEEKLLKESLENITLVYQKKRQAKKE